MDEYGTVRGLPCFRIVDEGLACAAEYVGGCNVVLGDVVWVYDWRTRPFTKLHKAVVTSLAYLDDRIHLGFRLVQPAASIGPVVWAFWGYFSILTPDFTLPVGPFRRQVLHIGGTVFLDDPELGIAECTVTSVNDHTGHLGFRKVEVLRIDVPLSRLVEIRSVQ